MATTTPPSRPEKAKCLDCKRRPAPGQERCGLCATKRSVKGGNLKKRYGMSIEEFDRVSKQQGGACAICQISGTLEVDHDHKTGEIRGLLCTRCNKLLGVAGDSRDILIGAAGYLEWYS